MPFSFIVQCVFYDRPRLMHKLKRQLIKKQDLDHYIRSLDTNDPFKKIAMKRLDELPEVIRRMKEFHIQWLDSSHVHFPKDLFSLADPPMGLFYFGDSIYLMDRLLGMVGTRRPSITAYARVEALLSDVKGYSTVSGGALGIDALVHQFSVDLAIPTVVVLASGLDCMAPKTNQLLFQKVIRSGRGCIISECPPGVVPKPYFFPQRNRLIAALSRKVIVVEAAQRSGAVLTANLAAGLGKDVGAVVAGFNSPQSMGCYLLMNDGAFVIGNRGMFADFLGILDPHSSLCSSENSNDLLESIPTEPIHVEDLSSQLAIPLDKMIEYVTSLSLNGDVIISSGQMVSRIA